jgi:hypothetical protein
LSVIVWAVAKTPGSNVIVEGVALLFAVATAFRKLMIPLPGGNIPSSVVFTTTAVSRNRRSSNWMQAPVHERRGRREFEDDFPTAAKDRPSITDLPSR